MSEISTEVLYEGQLATATLEQNGTVISEPNKKSTQVLVRDEQGNEQLATATYQLNKEADQIPLLSITTAPSGTFAVGSKYYNSTNTLIYTAVTANTWDGATTAAPSVIPTYYLFDGATYYWDGNSLEKTDTSAFEVKANKTNSFTSTSEVTYPSSKGLSDGLANKANLVDGKVPSSELPSYVNDVVDFLTVSDTAPEDAAEGDMYYAPTAKLIYTYASGSWGSGGTPEKGKIYIAVDTNLVYRWSGTNMVEIAAGGGGAPTIAYFDVAAEATTVNTGVNLSAKTVKVYFNGLLQRPNVGATDYDYEITTTEGVSSVVFNTAFTAAAVICVEYI